MKTLSVSFLPTNSLDNVFIVQLLEVRDISLELYRIGLSLKSKHVFAFRNANCVQHNSVELSVFHRAPYIHLLFNLKYCGECFLNLKSL